MMRKIVTKRMNVNILQVILPLLFFVYFDHYIILKEAIHTADISLEGVLSHVLTYFLLLIVVVYTTVISCQNEKGIIYGMLGWIEAVVLWVLPLISIWQNDLFIRIKGYLIDYLHIYGSIVLLYSIQLFINGRIRRRVNDTDSI